MLVAEPLCRFTLVYGNWSSSNVMFKEELQDIKDTYLARFNIVWVMSRETQDIALFNGRIDYDKTCELLTNWIDPASIYAAFIRGPQEITRSVTQALLDKGLGKPLIKSELFSTGLPARARAMQGATQGNAQCEIEVVLNGSRHIITMPKNGISLVDAGLKVGIDMPYACKGDVCSTCRALIVSGEVDMDNNVALDCYEVARGFVLCFQSFPVSRKVVIYLNQEHIHA